ncbi:MAG: Zinc-type alcohol dehydrogenase-like protein [Akkermansiaceae bacterium]|nr:Zinc-type alcohol dehydrogenase-like protein [Akkermansiaceae bacterium]
MKSYLPVDREESFVDTRVPRPVPGDRDLLVAVKAISVNPVDTQIRSGQYKLFGEDIDQSPHILGWDVSGEVVGVGPGVHDYKVGDQVFYSGDITRPGADSEFHLVDERLAGRKPASLSYGEAAALPLTGITAWESLFDRLKISPDGKDAGKSILIIGGGGGVGSMAIQLAAKVAKLRVIGTASSEESRAWVTKLGASVVVDHRNPLDKELAAKGIETVDYILVLGYMEQHWPAMVKVIAPQGSIASIKEAKGDPVDISALKPKSVTFAWETVFTRPSYQTTDMVEQQRLLNSISKMVDKGELISTANEVMKPINAANLQKAHAKIEQGHTVGKIVLEGWE